LEGTVRDRRNYKASDCLTLSISQVWVERGTGRQEKYLIYRGIRQNIQNNGRRKS
jgi:hypothetical protein